MNIFYCSVTFRLGYTKLQCVYARKLNAYSVTEVRRKMKQELGTYGKEPNLSELF